jgi:hypothetical protein
MTDQQILIDAIEKTGDGYEVDFLGLSRVRRVSHVFDAVHQRLGD